jgi:hypothetical protein
MSLEITLTKTASKSFLKDLRANGIAIQAVVKTTFYFLEDSGKLQMAIRLVKERFGTRSIIVKHF